MFRQAYRLQIRGESHVVWTSPADHVRMVRAYPDAAAKPAPLEEMLYLVHLAAVRAGLFDGSFDDFLEAVEDVEVVQDASPPPSPLPPD